MKRAFRHAFFFYLSLKEVSGTLKIELFKGILQLHLKSYQEHLRNAGYCALQWRILRCKLDENKRLAEDLPKFQVVPVYCNSQACPRCARIRFKKIHKRFRYKSIDTSWRMFTLTSVKNIPNSQQELIKMEANFRELRKFLQRKYPNFKYFAVKELSPKGMWHYHGIWNIRIDVKVLSAKWQEISGAYRVWLEKVRSPRAAVNYTFKYIYKSTFNPKERELLYNSDKRKFSYSKGLLNKDCPENPYTCDIGVQYSVEELKKELHNIIFNSQLSFNDFASNDYPYFEDLIYNIFYDLYNNSPPDLFNEWNHKFA